MRATMFLTQRLLLLFFTACSLLSGHVALGVNMPASAVDIDDADPGWTWSGMTAVDDDSLHNATGHAGGPGANCAYTFNGSGVDIYGMAGPTVAVDERRHKLGGVRVYLDGKLIGTYSEAKPSTAYDYKLAEVHGLSDGNHVLQMEPDGGWAGEDPNSIALPRVIAPTIKVGVIIEERTAPAAALQWQFLSIGHRPDHMSLLHADLGLGSHGLFLALGATLTPFVDAGVLEHTTGGRPKAYASIHFVF